MATIELSGRVGGAVAAATPPLVAQRRVNVVLTERAHAELLSLSRETMRSMTELIRLGLGLVKIAVEAKKNSQRLIVTTEDGEAVKEIVLPS